jgi:hypothetical protein
MKKINVKKLNGYLMNPGNSQEMKSFVQDCVYSFLNVEDGSTVSPIKIAFLNDLGLLEEVK